MKSEKANEYLSKCVEVRKLTFCAADIEYAVELAEQEAEERMRDKAIEAFRTVCFCDDKDAICNTCPIMEKFIQKLNEE